MRRSNSAYVLPGSGGQGLTVGVWRHAGRRDLRRRREHGRRQFRNHQQWPDSQRNHDARPGPLRGGQIDFTGGVPQTLGGTGQVAMSSGARIDTDNALTLGPGMTLHGAGFIEGISSGIPSRRAGQPGHDPLRRGHLRTDDRRLHDESGHAPEHRQQPVSRECERNPGGHVPGRPQRVPEHPGRHVRRGSELHGARRHDGPAGRELHHPGRHDALRGRRRDSRPSACSTARGPMPAR